MNDTFRGAAAFNGNITNWNVGNVTSMNQMFNEAKLFNQDISGWDVSKVTDMSGMFRYSAFNQDIGNWVVTSVTNMSTMFTFTPFNQDIGGWNVSNVNNMSSMFGYARSFNQNLGAWQVGNVTNMSNMFIAANSFDQDLSKWEVGKVTNMSGMFSEATVFNQNIGGWDVTSVTNMSSMFSYNPAFNQDIGSWNVGKVTNMSSMFRSATSFNQDISGWDVSSVTLMSSMFRSATNFEQNIGSWNIAKVTNMTDMFNSVELSVENYDALISGWSAQTVSANVAFHGGTSKYSCSAIAARAILTESPNSWTITDAGRSTTACPPGAPTDLSVTEQDRALEISFTLGNDGGGAITNYEYQLDGGEWVAFDPAVTASPVTITGLTNGTPYSIKLRAVNEIGSGAESESVTGTPVGLSSFGCVIVVGSGGADEGSGWKYANNTISPSSASNVNVNASDVLAKMALGDLTVAGSCITVNADVNYSADANSLTLKASGSIILTQGYKIATNGGDVILWADADADRAGGIRVGSDFAGVFTTAISSNGGDIILSGGTDPVSGYAQFDSSFGVAYSNYYYSLGVFGATLDASGSGETHGDILIRGNGGNTFTGLLWSVDIGGQYGANTKLMTKGAGTITIVGDGSEAPPNPTPNNSRNSVGVNARGTYETESGDIHVIGKANVARLNARGIVAVASMQSVSGSVTVDDQTPSTNSVNYTGTFITQSTLGKGTLASSSSNLRLVADKIILQGPLSMTTTGSVTIEPVGDSFLEVVALPSGVVIDDTATSFTIGKSTNQSGVTISSPQSVAGPISVYGGYIQVNANLTATEGDILLDADAGTPLNTGKDGVIVADNVTVETVTSGDVTVIGRTGNGNLSGVKGYTDASGTAITSAGALSITGISNSTSNTVTRGFWLRGTYTADGDITLTGRDDTGDDATFTGARITSTNGAVDVYAKTADDDGSGAFYTGGTNTLTAKNDISIFADGMFLSASVIAFDTDGKVNLLPTAGSTTFTSAMTLGAGNTFDTGITGLTVGVATNTADITLNGVVNIAGPITLYGGNVAIKAALTATGADINLHATGAVTQTAAVTADGLGLHGTGTFTLTNAGNNVATIAGGDAETKLGSLSFTDASGGLAIGSVNPVGITSTGKVLVETLAGDITISEGIATDATTADAVVVNAGKSTAIGTVTGGDIKISGEPSVTTGTGGIAKLLSGSKDASTGLSGLAGEGNTRFYADETTTTFTPALEAGNVYAVYRELGITAPEAPTDLAATPGDGQIEISFTPGSDGGSAVTN